MTHLLFLGTVVWLQSVTGFFKWQLNWKTADVMTLAHLCENFLKCDLIWECELILKDKDNIFLLFIWGENRNRFTSFKSQSRNISHISSWIERCMFIFATYSCPGSHTTHLNHLQTCQAGPAGEGISQVLCVETGPAASARCTIHKRSHLMLLFVLFMKEKTKCNIIKTMNHCILWMIAVTQINFHHFSICWKVKTYSKCSFLRNQSWASKRSLLFGNVHMLYLHLQSQCNPL